MSQYIVDDSKKAWEANAEFWDEHIGDDSNQFHREVIRPKVSELLDIKENDFILDIACGNGNYAAYIAERGADVVAFDYSSKMIELAEKRQHKYKDKIEFHVIDATNEKELRSLKKDRLYTKAVSNMAIMDIVEISVLFQCVNALLIENGTFVFATQHPCFVTLTEKYMTTHSYNGEAITGQPQLQCYYHRSLQDIFNICFKSGFIVDGFYEECYGVKENPDVIIVRARKL